MNRSIFSRFYEKHRLPFQQVLIAQWLLLIVALSMNTLSFPFSSGADPLNMSIALGSLTVLALLSLNFPDRETDGSFVKALFICSELALVSLAALFGVNRFVTPLYLITLAKSCLLFDGLVMWLAVLACFLCQTLVNCWKSDILGFITRPGDLTSTILGFVFCALILNVANVALMPVVALLIRSVVSEQKARQRSEELSKEVESLAAQVERVRIAREIHDTLGHTLTSLKLQLEVARKFGDSDILRSKEALNQAELLAARSLSDVRIALQSIRNANFDFRQSVNELVQTPSASELSVELQLDEVAVPGKIGYQLFRVIQECLTNTLKHADATKVKIATHTKDNKILLSFQDNGRGFAESDEPEGYGLRGIKERVENLRGALSISGRQSEGGVKLVAEIPLRDGKE